MALGELVMSKGGAGGMARRRWSAEEKAGIVLESLAPGVNLAELCRSHQVSASQVYGWRESSPPTAIGD